MMKANEWGFLWSLVQKPQKYVIEKQNDLILMTLIMI